MKLAQIKKGSNAGNTELAHNETPFFAESKAMDGNMIIAKQPMQAAAPASIQVFFISLKLLIHHHINDP